MAGSPLADDVTTVSRSKQRPAPASVVQPGSAGATIDARPCEECFRGRAEPERLAPEGHGALVSGTRFRLGNPDPGQRRYAAAQGTASLGRRCRSGNRTSDLVAVFWHPAVDRIGQSKLGAMGCVSASLK
jgi:hypothetical protein